MRKKWTSGRWKNVFRNQNLNDLFMTYLPYFLWNCTGMYIYNAGIILWMRPANERWRYIVMSSLIGWGHTQNDPCIMVTSGNKPLSELSLTNIVTFWYPMRHCVFKIIKSLKPVRLLVKIFISLWNLVDGSAAMLLQCRKIFRVVGNPKHQYHTIKTLSQTDSYKIMSMRHWT